MNTRAKYITAGVVALMLAVSCCLIVLFPREKAADGVGGLTIQKDVIDWNETLEVKNETGQDSVKMPYYGDITMQAGQKTIGVTLVNPKENNCYFVYELSLHDTGEKIYTSGLIEPGKAIDGIRGTRSVKKGDYNLDITIKAYTIPQKQPLNNAVVKTKLIAA